MFNETVAQIVPFDYSFIKKKEDSHLLCEREREEDELGRNDDVTHFSLSPNTPTFFFFITRLGGCWKRNNEIRKREGEGRAGQK